MKTQIEPFQPNDDSYQQLIDVYNAVWTDNRLTAGQLKHGDESRTLTPTGLDHYERTVLQNPEFLPEANYVALDGDEYVGMSSLWRDLGNPERLNTGLTGVKRSYRQRGIATALKVHGTRFAQANGARMIETGNEENNPMFQLNLQLGYKPKPAWIDFVRELDPLA